MVFSSPLFLFAYLPAVLACYFLSPKKLKNAVLLTVSLLFYLVGAGGYILLLFFSIGTNYYMAHGIPGAKPLARKILMGLAIASNIVPLVVYKYAAFGTTSANAISAWLGHSVMLPIPEFFLPAGISFFTFQGLAYVIDVYRGEVKPCSSLIDFALFKAFFPQLVAGPIVRYHDLARELPSRSHSLESTVSGLERFGFGLAKKVLIADTLGKVADSIFGANPSEWSATNAWLALVCYTMQIFFDFSGYSDMAIGLGRICGLSLPENFRQPYTSTSITEFWRRWHITLSSWFRDYLYIPMGGNRSGIARTGFNLLIVFALCGLWHGANVTFLLWGLFHGFLLVAERVAKHVWGLCPSGAIGWVYSILSVMLGWILFRSPSLPHARVFFRALFGFSHADPLFPISYHLTTNVCFILLVGLVASLWSDKHSTDSKTNPASAWSRARPWAALILCALAVITQAPKSFNPFIYFQF